MGIAIATNFDCNISDPIDSHTKFATKADLLACEFKKVGVPVFVVDEKQPYVLLEEGGDYVPLLTSSIETMGEENVRTLARSIFGTSDGTIQRPQLGMGTDAVQDLANSVFG